MIRKGTMLSATVMRYENRFVLAVENLQTQDTLRVLL